MYTHAGPFGDGYEIGVATAPSPTGPWTLRDDVNPVLVANETWNSHTAGVACACIVKRGIASDLDGAPDYHDAEDGSAIPLGGNHTYLMYYCGTDGASGEHSEGDGLRRYGGYLGGPSGGEPDRDFGDPRQL